ncbi:hypothetical protein D3C80_2041730 [compost metagenome]
MPAVQTDHSAQRPVLLQGSLSGQAGEPFLTQCQLTAQRVPLLTQTDQLASAAYQLPVYCIDILYIS